ncbi:hypothetical protein HDU93_007647, partial [Gonapodya sp. JEL0774]
TRLQDATTLNHVLERPDLYAALTKLCIFDPQVTGRWETVVFLDADTLPMQNIHELFGALAGGAQLAAAPDTGWPDMFNSGVFVTKPDRKVYEELVEMSVRDGSMD